jgi:hypothetical protein
MMHGEIRKPPVPAFVVENLDAAAVKQAAKAASADDLIYFAKDGRTVARANAWRCFAALGSLDEYGAMLAMVGLKDSEPVVCVEAARALVHAPDHTLGRVVASLLRARIHSERDVRDGAAEALEAMKSRTLPALLVLLDERNDDIASHLVYELAAHGDAAGVKVLKLLEDEPGPIQATRGLAALRVIGGKSLMKGYPLVAANLKNSFDPTRLQAVRALKPLADEVRKDAEVYKHLVFMGEEDVSIVVRFAVSDVLESIGPIDN